MSRMFHAGLLSICIGCSTSAALAQGTVSLYGLLDASAGSFQDAGNPRLREAASGKMSTSFLGIRGREDLGGGLRAEFVLEQFLRVDSGSNGRFNGDAFWARNAYVGLGGAWGTLQLGRNTTPLFVSTLLFNAFGDSFGFSPSIRQLFTPRSGQAFLGDTGWNNSVGYASPVVAGLSAVGLVNAGEGAANATGANSSLALRYSGASLAASATWQQVKNGATTVPAGWQRQSTWQVGASYDLKALKLFAQWSEVDTRAAQSTDASLLSVGAAVPLGQGRLIAQAGRSRTQLLASKVTHSTYSAGYVHAASKRTDLYTVLMTDRLTNRAEGRTVAAGIRHRF